ncbi:MAG: SMC-Scp complex subunit ScpB [Candidatus Paceibacterota bacterium]|jgi:segregation and condensation protein B
MNLDAKIEGLLFFKGEPISRKELGKLLKANMSEINDALALLTEKLNDRGLTLVFKEDDVILGTNSELSTLIEDLRKEEINKELSKASLETIAIILYKEFVTRSEIDYIRGVNSSFILRNLLIRGLIEKVNHPEDNRKFAYKPSFELLQFMGVSKIEDLPDFESIKQTLAKNISEQSEGDEEIK